MTVQTIAMIGFGEAAHAFASSWEKTPNRQALTYDLKVEHSSTRDALYDRAASCDVVVSQTMEQALANADVVLSLVTADQALVAARAAAPHLRKHALYLDCNSCSPQTKQQAAHEIEACGGRYVDVAVMAPVYPKRHHVPLLVSGQAADDAVKALSALEMRPVIAGNAIGQASSIKMIRSIIIKGFEALTAEAMLCAFRAGVADQVLQSLQASDPAIDWEKRSAYNLERMMVHGERRAAEMREVAETVRQFGITERLASATADWQQQIGSLHLAPESEALDARVGQILKALAMGGEGAGIRCDIT